MINIGVTGANGFVGSALCRKFAEYGWGVVRLCRQSRQSVGTFRPFDLTKKIEPGSLQGIDVLVHAAYDSAARHEPQNSNLQGTRALFEAAATAGVRQIVLISSMAAASDSASQYGLNKYLAEQLLDLSRDIAIRPGLVIGSGGLFRSICRNVTRYHVAPLFRGGNQPVYVVGIDDLCTAVFELIKNRSNGRYTIANQDPVLMSDLYRAIAKQTGSAVVLLPLPYGMALRIASLAERLGLRLPIDSERLNGLQNLRIQDVSADAAPGISPAPLPVLLNSALTQ